MQRRRREITILVAWGLATGGLAVRAPLTAAEAGRDVAGVSTRCRELVTELGYPAEVGDRFVAFADGFPLVRWANALDAARDAAPGSGGTASVAAVEGDVIDEMRRRLHAVIRQADGASGYWKLGDVLADKRAQCLGNCQLWHLLGTTVGLQMAAVEVTRPAAGELGEHETHVATLIRLADGRVRMVDTRYGVDSAPFRFGEVYRRDGAMWMKASLGADRGLPRRVRPLGRGGLQAAILLNIANTYRRAGQEPQAAPIYERGVEADPGSAALRLAVAETCFRVGRWDDAERSIDEALEIDAQASDAHAARGRLLMRQNRWREAVAAFDRAIAVKPESPDARRSRAEAERRSVEATRAVDAPP